MGLVLQNVQSWEDDNSNFQGSLPSSIYVTPHFVDCRPWPAIASSIMWKEKTSTYFNPSVYSTLLFPLKKTSTKNKLTIMKQAGHPWIYFFLPKHEVCAFIVKPMMSQVDFYLVSPWGLSGLTADHTHDGPITASPSPYSDHETQLLCYNCPMTQNQTSFLMPFAWVTSNLDFG